MKFIQMTKSERAAMLINVMISLIN